MKIQKSDFGFMPDGRKVYLFTLENDNNVTVKITNYGGIITSIETPDKNGKVENIACGFDTLEEYLSKEYQENYPYFGCIIGRFGNRIANGHLEIEGKVYQLAINNDANHLHGGLVGFDRILWDAEAVEEDGKVGVKISYLSPDMEENYPGNLKVSCIYTLDNENNLKLEYFAETDKTTVVNLTNHSYFNLTSGKETIFNHKLHLLATKMTEMDNQIPTGKIVEVAGTPYDFTTPKLIGKDFASLTIGYDDNYVLDNENGELKYIACVTEETSGRKIEVLTTQPGVQLYTGYFMKLKKYPQFTGFALETQHYPDSVNRPVFPTTLLKPGEKYHEVTIYKFG